MIIMMNTASLFNITWQRLLSMKWVVLGISDEVIIVIMMISRSLLAHTHIINLWRFLPHQGVVRIISK